MLLGTWAAWAITGGFEALTSEQARRLDISRRQPAAPHITLVDQDGQVFPFDEWVRKQDRFLIVDFIYTGCQSLCRALGTEFQQLQRGIVERNQQQRVHLLSVSFDPEHDGPATLRSYAEHMQGNGDVWTFATVADAADLDRLLRTFGVTVIADRQGGFQHNAALVWVSPSARLVRVTDFDDGRFRLPDELPRSN